MATADNNTPKVDGERYERKAIELDLALKSFLGAQAQLANSTGRLIIVSVGALIVTSFVDPRGPVAIPSLGLTLDKIHASEVLLVLTCAALYNWAGMNFYAHLLRLKVHRLCLEVGYETFPWYAAQPTPFSFQTMFIFLSRFARGATLTVSFVFALIVYSLPIYLMIKIGTAAAYSGHWLVSSVLSCIFLLASFIITGASPRGSEAEGLLNRVDAFFNLHRAAPGGEGRSDSGEK